MSFTHPAPSIARLEHELPPDHEFPLERDFPPAAHIPVVLQTLACRRWPFHYVQHCRARYGECFTIRPVDMPPLVFLSDPRDIRAVVTAPADVLHPGAGGAVMAPLFGESSFAVREEDEHSSGRNAIMPAFHRQAVQAHADMLADVAESEIASWPLDTAFPLETHLQKLTMRVMLRTVIGGEDSACQTLQEPLLGMLSVMASFVLQEPRLRRVPGWRRTWRRFVERRHEVDELISALIGRRRHEDDRRGDLLGMLLGAHNPDGLPMSDRQVRDNLVSVIIAGHETTAATLAWTFQLLAHNPLVQHRLIREIDGGVGDEYMNATIQEILRHKPAFLFIPPRAIVKPIEIGSRTYHPPAQLLGCTYLMHHDPGLYSDPHVFRAERFLGETPQPGTWLPWGAGRKRCPGRHLALLEIETVLQKTLSRLVVLPASAHIEHPRWRSVILTPHAGSRVILHTRRPLSDISPTQTPRSQI